MEGELPDRGRAGADRAALSADFRPRAGGPRQGVRPVELHRLSGAIVFLLVPVLFWLLDKSLSSPEGFAQVQEIFNGFFVRFIVWVFVAGLIYHFIAGVKHLLANLGFAVELQSGRIAATISLILSAIGIIAAFIWIVI